MIQNKGSLAQLQIRVQWGEMDALQHVNNSVYLRWVESARLIFFDTLAEGTIDQSPICPILAWQDIKYISPVVYPDQVKICFDIIALEEDRIQGEARIYSVTQNRLVAISKNTLMAYDTLQLKKAPMPAHWRKKIKAFYGESIEVNRPS